MVSFDLDIKKDDVSPAMRKWAAKSPILTREILGGVAWQAKTEIRKDLQNGSLKKRTGELFSSVRYDFRGNNAVVVYSKHRAARFHERGGVIYPKKPGGLLFVPIREGVKSHRKGDPRDLINGIDFVLAKSIKIPARPFMRPAIQKLATSGEPQRIANRIIPKIWRECV